MGRYTNPFLILICLALACSARAQRIVAEGGFISFFSEAPLEDIRAENRKVSSIFDPSSGNIAFSVPIRQFQFAKSLMQEHFNDKYMESDKFPTAVFSGKVLGYSLDTRGAQQVKAVGDLTIHGVKRKVEVPGTVNNLGNSTQIKAKFIVKLEDYKITIPQLLWQNIAEQVEVEIDLSYKPQN